MFTTILRFVFVSVLTLTATLALPQTSNDKTKNETKATGVDTKQSNAIARILKGPDVVLVETEKRSIYEYRQNGKLTMIKVVPKKGKPYYLVPADPTLHGGDLERADALIPRWVIKKF